MSFFKVEYSRWIKKRNNVDMVAEIYSVLLATEFPYQMISI